MSFHCGEVLWGATVDGAPVKSGRGGWTVKLLSEPLGSLANHQALARFSDAAAKLAPEGQPACALIFGAFDMTLTVEADGPDEAETATTQVFERTLEAALWPRSVMATLTPRDVIVAPEAALAAAA